MNVLYANVAYDLAVWLAIPLHWGAEASWATPRAWAAETARDRWLHNNPRRNDVERTEGCLTIVGERYGVRDSDGPEVITYVHLPHPGMLPLLVKVWIDEAEGMTLDDAAVTDDPHCVEPPIVEDFATEHLGAGIRVLRYVENDLSRDGSGEMSLFAQVHYAFLVPGEDAVVLARCVELDLARLMQAMDDIDDLVREIRWAYEPQDLASGRKAT